MTLRLQIVIAVLDILAILYIGNLVRKRILELKYALVWFGVTGVLLVIDIFPDLINWLTAAVGISLPINMLFFLGFCFTLMIVFTQTIIITNFTRRNKRLTQEIALMNQKIESLAEQIQAEKNKEPI